MENNTAIKNQRLLVLTVSVALIASITVIVMLMRQSEPVNDSLISQYEVHKTDEVEFTLEPFQSLEYKYLMDRGSSLVFSWQADGELYFDLHAENTTVEDYEESYAESLADHQMGVYEAAFNGMHGWFWENRGFDTVTLRLKTSGFYVNATEYRGGGTSDRSPAPVF